MEKPFMRPWCLESGSLTWVPLIALGRNTRRGGSRELNPAHSATGCISNSPAEPPSRCPGRGEDQTPWRGRGRGSDPLGRTGAGVRRPDGSLFIQRAEQILKLPNTLLIKFLPFVFFLIKEKTLCSLIFTFPTCAPIPASTGLPSVDSRFKRLWVCRHNL